MKDSFHISHRVFNLAPFVSHRQRLSNVVRKYVTPMGPHNILSTTATCCLAQMHLVQSQKGSQKQACRCLPMEVMLPHPKPDTVSSPATMSFPLKASRRNSLSHSLRAGQLSSASVSTTGRLGSSYSVRNWAAERPPRLRNDGSVGRGTVMSGGC